MTKSFRFLRASVFLLGSFMLLNLFFQNCSPVKFTDLEAASRALEVERLAIGADVEVVTVGLNPVPDLKLIFVVDNSGTMKQNQLNLSASFGTMFDASSASLNKFDSTTYLINTAQTVPSFKSEKAVLDKIATQQSNFIPAALIPQAMFDSLIRTPTLNSGYFPGDNIGYQISKITTPLTYNILPAPVLGIKNNAGIISVSNSIRKPALADVKIAEKEFKDRLAVLSADRIPSVLDNSVYKPDNFQVVDTESGLCAVARILRNPGQYIKAGDLLSFTIVSDENDNDPSGIKCVQSITQFDGTEDLVDGDCKFKETQIFYNTQTTTQKPDDCKISSNAGYNFQFHYNSSTNTTDVTYKYVKTAAAYKAYYYDLQYTSIVNSYSYYNTAISYYVQICNDVYSDGIKISTKCVVDPVVKTGSKDGDFVDATKCFDLAKSLNVNAINDVGYKPICTASFVSRSTACNAIDPLCKITPNFKTDNKVKNILGEFTPATCLAKAMTFGDYNKDAVCTDSSRTVSPCSTAESAARCDLITAAVYDFKSGTASGNQTADGCLSWAKGQAGNAVVSLSDITKCQLITTPNTPTVSGTLSFADSKLLDGGVSLPVGAAASCGVLKDLAYGKSSAAIQAAKIDDCVLTSIYKASDITELKAASDCSVQATNKCSSIGFDGRNCSGSLITYQPATTTNPTAVNDVKVKEFLSCSSLCSDSKLSACGANPLAGQTVDAYLKAKYGSALICGVTNTNLETNKESLVGKLLSQEALLCPASLAKEPRYFFRTKGPYRSQALVTDYVSGTKKDANNIDQVIPLVEYIKSKVAQLNTTNQVLFSALVRKSTDSLGQGGSVGVDYKALIDQTQGQLDSVLSPDYSIALKELSRIIKNNLERTFILNKMRPDQIIMKVSLIKKDTKEIVELQKADWIQNGATLKISEGFEFVEGDQFQVDFQNIYNK